MVDLMKIEDPFSPPGDQPDLNKLRGEQHGPFLSLGESLSCVRFASAVCSSQEGRGAGDGDPSREDASPGPCPRGPPHASMSAPPLLVLPVGRARGRAGAGRQGAASWGLQGVGVELRTRQAGLPRP